MPQFRVVNTDNFGRDYANEKFVGPEFDLRCDAQAYCNTLNEKCGDYSQRYHKVVKLPYTLDPAFEP